MTLKTAGTNATTSLSAFLVGFNDIIPADVATLLTQMRGDPPGFIGGYGQVNAAGNIVNQGVNRSRQNAGYMHHILNIPNRGRLITRPGDYVLWDPTTGWPMLLSGDAAANGPYTHT